VYQASHVAYELMVGPIPPGLHVLHRCDNPPCVNPVHLFLGTNLDNIKDKMAKKRYPHGEAHAATKLTESQVKDIRQRHANGGINQTHVAKEFGVSWSIIHDVIRRKTWRDLP